MFHDTYPVGDWESLVDRLDRHATLSRWSESEPTLRGLASVDALPPPLAPGSDPDRADALLGALVRTGCRAGAGDPDAVLVLVHLLSDGLRAAAARLSDLADDILTVLVGELCVQIRAWPLRRTRAYAANLLRDTRRGCLRELRPGTRGADGGRLRELLIDPLDPVAARVLHRPHTDPDDEDDLDLADVFDWARRHQIATTRDLQLVLALERERGYGTATRHRVAAAFGIHERTLRRRRDRTLAALRAAAPHYPDIALPGGVAPGVAGQRVAVAPLAGETGGSMSPAPRGGSTKSVAA